LASGFSAAYFGYALPILASACCGGAAIFLLSAIPESLPAEAPCRLEQFELHPFQAFYNIAMLFTHKPDYGMSPLPWFSVAFFLFYFSLMGWVNVVYVYVKHIYDWSPTLIGGFDSALGLFNALSMLYLTDAVHYLVGRDFKIATWIKVGYFVR
jgi:hypothetical protein